MFEAAHDASYANSNMERAILKGDLEEVKRCLGNGADINFTPMDAAIVLVAANFKHWEVVDYLLDNGANINVRNSYNLRLLNVLAKDAPLALVEKVVSMGAIINTKDNDLETPFAVAVKNNRHDVVDYFLDIAGTDFTSLDKYSKSTLHYAAEKGHKDMFMKLWYQGVDLSLRDMDNKTAVEYILDQEWRDDLPEFEKKVIEVAKEREEEKTGDDEAPEVKKETLKATGISSIKRRAPAKA